MKVNELLNPASPEPSRGFSPNETDKNKVTAEPTDGRRRVDFAQNRIPVNDRVVQTLIQGVQVNGIRHKDISSVADDANLKNAFNDERTKKLFNNLEQVLQAYEASDLDTQKPASNAFFAIQKRF